MVPEAIEPLLEGEDEDLATSRKRLHRVKGCLQQVTTRVEGPETAVIATVPWSVPRR